MQGSRAPFDEAVHARALRSHSISQSEKKRASVLENTCPSDRLQIRFIIELVNLHFQRSVPLALECSLCTARPILKTYRFCGASRCTHECCFVITCGGRNHSPPPSTGSSARAPCGSPAHTALRQTDLPFFLCFSADQDREEVTTALVDLHRGSVSCAAHEEKKSPVVSTFMVWRTH